MAALTATRTIVKMNADATLQKLNLGAAAVNCYGGGIAVKNASGFATPATTATGLLVVGVFEEDCLNASGAAGAKKVNIRQGVFKMNNSSAGDLITIADIGTFAYVVDDNTVAKTNGTGTRSVAGMIVNVEADGSVFVEISLCARKA